MRVSERRTVATVAGLSEVVGARWFRTALVLSGLMGTGVALGGVGCSSADCSFDATCLDPIDAGGDSGVVVWPVGCTPGAEPKDDVDCLADSIGVFVSSSRGSDEATVGDGSKANPFRTVRKALELYSKQRHRIYICEGDYRGNLVFEARHSGLEIYGAFACDDWHYTGVLSKIRAEDTNLPAAQWKGLTSGKVRDVEISADAATKDGGSSIAVFTANSTLDFGRVKLIAGDGKRGLDGVLIPFKYVDPTTLNGDDGTTLAGGNGKSSTCQSGTPATTGGTGGGLNGNGTKGTPDLGQGAGGGGGGACANGGGGAPGGAGGTGAGATVVGVLSAANGWTSESGKDGAHGVPGQGGGGGGGGSAGGGGGGGAGGCGGTGGPGGQAGGSSIALASLDSQLTVTDSEFIAGSGQDAGKGVDGQAGQGGGGFGGNRGGGNACPGGAGGAGGKGGAGGGGAGGISVGVLIKGASPNIDTQTQQRISFKTFGAAGAGALSTNGGVPGVAGPTLRL